MIIHNSMLSNGVNQAKFRDCVLVHLKTKYSLGTSGVWSRFEQYGNSGEAVKINQKLSFFFTDRVSPNSCLHFFNHVFKFHLNDCNSTKSYL